MGLHQEVVVIPDAFEFQMQIILFFFRMTFDFGYR